MPFVVATYVYASSQGQRTHSARTKIKLTYPKRGCRISLNTGHQLAVDSFGLGVGTLHGLLLGISHLVGDELGQQLVLVQVGASDLCDHVGGHVEGDTDNLVVHFAGVEGLLRVPEIKKMLMIKNN